MSRKRLPVSLCCYFSFSGIAQKTTLPNPSKTLSSADRDVQKMIVETEASR